MKCSVSTVRLVDTSMLAEKERFGPATTATILPLMSKNTKGVENLPSNNVTISDCQAMRNLFYNGHPQGFIAGDLDYSTDTVRKHLCGECNHTGWVKSIEYNPYLGNRFGCSMCDKRFPSLVTLQDHISHMHQ